MDPLPMDSLALRQLETFGVPTTILITNENHQRASLEMQKKWKIPILAGEGAELVADEYLREGQTILENLQILHLPGAGKGEIAVLQKNVLGVFGDFLIHLEPDRLELLPEKYCENSELARRSLSRLRGWDIPILLFAHGLPIMSEGSLHLEKLLKTTEN